MMIDPNALYRLRRPPADGFDVMNPETWTQRLNFTDSLVSRLRS
jgi:hypothetical protein